MDDNYNSDSSDDSSSRREIELDQDINRYECEAFVDDEEQQYTSTPNRINRPHLLHNDQPLFSSERINTGERNDHNSRLIKALRQELAKQKLENGQLMMRINQKDEKIARLLSTQIDIVHDFRRKLVIVAQEQESMRHKLNKYKRSLLFIFKQ